MSSSKATINQIAHDKAMNVGNLSKQVNINNPFPTGIRPPKPINPYKPFAQLVDQYPITPLIRHTFLYLLKYYPRSANLILGGLYNYIYDYSCTCEDFFKSTMYKLIHTTWFSSFNMIKIAEIVGNKLTDDYGNYELNNIYNELVEEWNKYMIQELGDDTTHKWIVDVGETDGWLFWMLIDTSNGSLWWPAIINVLYQKGAFCMLLNNGDVFIEYNKMRPFKMDCIFKEQSVNVIELNCEKDKLGAQWVDAVLEASKMINEESKIGNFFGFKYDGNLQKQQHEQKQKQKRSTKRKSEYALVQKDLKKSRHDMWNTKLNKMDNDNKNDNKNGNTDAIGSCDGGAFIFDTTMNKMDNDNKNGNTDAIGSGDSGAFIFDITMNTNNEKCVNDWTVFDVLDWLFIIGYEKYVDKLTPQFKDDEIDGRSLILMNMLDLKNYGIKNFYDRKTILKHIQNL